MCAARTPPPMPVASSASNTWRASISARGVVVVVERRAAAAGRGRRRARACAGGRGRRSRRRRPRSRRPRCTPARAGGSGCARSGCRCSAARDCARRRYRPDQGVLGCPDRAAADVVDPRDQDRARPRSAGPGSWAGRAAAARTRARPPSARREGLAAGLDRVEVGARAWSSAARARPAAVGSTVSSASASTSRLLRRLQRQRGLLQLGLLAGGTLLRPERRVPSRRSPSRAPRSTSCPPSRRARLLGLLGLLRLHPGHHEHGTRPLASASRSETRSPVRPSASTWWSRRSGTTKLSALRRSLVRTRPRCRRPGCCRPP